MSSTRISTFNRQNKEKRGQLGQVTPALNGTPEQIYAPNDNIEATGVMVTVVNDAAQDAEVIIYNDADGVITTLATTVAKRVVAKGEESQKVGLFLAMYAAGSIWVETDKAPDVTVTLWGTERPIE